MAEREEILYELLCAALAADSSGIPEDIGDLKQKIESFVRGNASLNDLSTMDKISLSQGWLRRLQGYDFLDPYLKDP